MRGAANISVSASGDLASPGYKAKLSVGVGVELGKGCWLAPPCMLASPLA